MKPIITCKPIYTYFRSVYANGEIHIKGAKVPGNENSTERKFHRTFVPEAKRPGSERARERKCQGAKVPGSELARVLLADSLRGANWPGSEKARYPSAKLQCRRHFC